MYLFSKELLQQFSRRDLIGLSAEPLLLYPTHYTGEPGYISDTEQTLTIHGEDSEPYRCALKCPFDLISPFLVPRL